MNAWQKWRQKRRAQRRPRLQPGEIVTFYDPTTGLIPVARLVVQEYTKSRTGTTMTLVDLVDLSQVMEARRVR